MTTSSATSATMTPLSPDELHRIDAWWRAANYLSVGQIYLMANPLLREPLLPEHVKPRLLGHWGTTPGLNFVYAHLNRAIADRDLDMIYIIGPGHGGPGVVASAYLEGSYSETYPDITRDEEGMARLFKQFSFPGGIPSHVAPETPGSIHEGGELGYSLSHAYGAAFDNPDLVVAAIVGDGEAETGPLATSWHSTKFVDPTRDGAVLPILHLNGYKIANPTVLARIPEEELDLLLRGYGHTPHFVTGDDPETMHQAFAATLDRALDEIQDIQRRARSGELTERPGLADDRAAQPQGLDRSQEGRRSAHRGVLALPPGALRRRPSERESSPHPRGVVAQLPTRGAVRRDRGPGRGHRRIASSRPAADEREPPRERRSSSARPAASRLPRVRRAGHRAGNRRGGGHQGSRHVPAGRDGPQLRSVPRLLAGREQLQPPPGHPGSDGPGLERRDLRLRRPPGP